MKQWLEDSIGIISWLMVLMFMLLGGIGMINTIPGPEMFTVGDWWMVFGFFTIIWGIGYFFGRWDKWTIDNIKRIFKK